jgi:hypothetical protein
MPIDPGIELLPDTPIAGPPDDLLQRAPLAERVLELACAEPASMARVVGLVGSAGAGKTSVVRLVQAALAERTDVAAVSVDGGEHPTAESLLGALKRLLDAFFSAAGVIETSDAARDALSRYGDVVSTVVRLVGVKVDVAGVVKRSTDNAAAELAENAQQLGKRLVVTIDHLDRLNDRELTTAAAALRMYAQVPYVTLLLAYDRRALTARAIDAAAVARLVTVELAIPPLDRVLLARLVAGGLARSAARLARDIDAVLPLFDPDAPGATALALLETPRDGKRAVNARAALLPLLPAGAELRRAALDCVVRLMAPALDSPRLTAVSASERRTRGDELRATVASSPIAGGLGAAIDELLTG